MNIRNFCIIAHIDHGKSTLADRFLEITGAVENRKMKAQILDQMELERERGITIKMAPVRMLWHPRASAQVEYVLNLIDTPGHSDFAYEVSRALHAVEGAILLVDATQGIQAQTLANLRAAEAAGLTLIGALNKVDMNPPGMDDLALELAELIHRDPDEIHRVSGKTGQGVEGLLQAVIEKIPPPSFSVFPRSVLRDSAMPARALVFDSFYDSHKGIVASVRVVNGQFEGDKDTVFLATKRKWKPKEIGIFAPELVKKENLEEGEIGYIATGVKDVEGIKIGDTVVQGTREPDSSLLLAGYKEPNSVVFISFYPEDADEHEELGKSLQKLRLTDSALSIEPDSNEVLGRGFKVGFLGGLHFEIIAERLKREFDIGVSTTFPSVAYRAKIKGEWRVVTDPTDLPPEVEAIEEPVVSVEILVPESHVNNFFSFQKYFRFGSMETETKGRRVLVRARMPLSELMSDFDDKLKSATQGYASFSYEFAGYERAEMVRVDFLVAGAIIPGMSRLLHKSTFETEARKTVERLKNLLPRQQFTQAVQATALGRVIARENIPALKKNVTGHLYGGDRTRKMKLWKKQKKGKEKLKERAHVEIAPDVFRELLKK